jgi:hypothetical protein
MRRPNRRYWEGLGAAHPFESYRPTYNLPVGEVYGLSQVFLELQEDNEDFLKQPYGCYVVHGVNHGPSGKTACGIYAHYL